MVDRVDEGVDSHISLPRPPDANAAGLNDGSRTVTKRVALKYKKMLAWQFAGTAVLVAIMFTFLFFPFIFRTYQPPVLILVSFTGVLGAFFSSLIRLYRIENITQTLTDEDSIDLDGSHLAIYSFVPPLMGAIAAVVLYVAFAADLVNGPLFPKFECKPTPCENLLQIVDNYRPDSGKDYAKALVWAFIAGFSERLVPDTLAGFISKKEAAA